MEEPIAIRLESDAFACDHVQVFELTGTEAISRPFRFDLGVVCTGEPLARDAVAGAKVAIVLERGGEELRRIHGMVAAIEDRLDSEVEHRTYQLRVVPRACLMGLVETQEIFLDMSIPDIVRQKLDLVGLSGDDVSFRLLGEYAAREFVAQYRETDLALCSRLCEHLGISYYFEHDGVDRIVFTDHAAGFQPTPGAETSVFRGRGDLRDVYELEVRSQLVPCSYVVRDWNYRAPKTDLTATYELDEGYGGGVVEHGAHVKTPAEAEHLARVRAEERLAGETVYVGKSRLPQLAAGGRTELDGHPKLEKIDLLVVEIEHRARQPVAMHGGKDGQGYENTFRAIPASRTFRPARVTPRPSIPGVVTGFVEQPLDAGVGKYAKIDEHGRYSVKLHFDAGAGGPRVSRPIRMAQPHAGESYGMHFPLKPGIEVLVAFVNGDPDRPIIVGAVPNPTTPSPVAAAESRLNRIKTVSGVVIEIGDGH